MTIDRIKKAQEMEQRIDALREEQQKFIHVECKNDTEVRNLYTYLLFRVKAKNHIRKMRMVLYVLCAFAYPLLIIKGVSKIRRCLNIKNACMPNEEIPNIRRWIKTGIDLYNCNANFHSQTDQIIKEVEVNKDTILRNAKSK